MGELENFKEKTEIKVYFNEDWDGLTYSLRLNKKELNSLEKSIGFEDKGFFIPKEKLDWIKKAEKEYFKSQQYISRMLRMNDLI